MQITTCLASFQERRRPMLADPIVPDAMATITNAITIDAPVGQVWPWLAQLGAGRGGWYSYDRIDNGGQPSANSILPEYQEIAPGDIFPATPRAKDAFVVAVAERPRNLVLTVPGTDGRSRVSWEFLLEPMDRERTRLITRGRVAPEWLVGARNRSVTQGAPIFIERVYGVLAVVPRPLLWLIAGFGHRLMVARQLRGIKRRAEAKSEAKGPLACTI